MPKLKTEQKTGTIERRLRLAFLDWRSANVGNTNAKQGARFRTVYEHGQWWVIAPSVDKDEGNLTFSVVDAEPGFDGFDFEGVS